VSKAILCPLGCVSTSLDLEGTSSPDGAGGKFMGSSTVVLGPGASRRNDPGNRGIGGSALLFKSFLHRSGKIRHKKHVSNITPANGPNTAGSTLDKSGPPEGVARQPSQQTRCCNGVASVASQIPPFGALALQFSSLIACVCIQDMARQDV
jgi:hypothetical protein